MKRYLLFAYPSYYPRGGWGDQAGWFDTPDEAVARGRKLAEELYGHFQVIDTENWEEVA